MFFLITNDEMKSNQVQKFGSLVGVCSYIKSNIIGRYDVENFIKNCFMTTKRNDIFHIDISWDEFFSMRCILPHPEKNYYIRIDKTGFDLDGANDFEKDFGYDGVGYVDRVYRDIFEYGFIQDEFEDEE